MLKCGVLIPHRAITLEHLLTVDLNTELDEDVSKVNQGDYYHAQNRKK